MKMTEEMEKMVNVVKKYDRALRKNNDLYKHYFAPNIPDNIIKKLIKIFDNHLPVNSLVAFYDTSLFSKCKAGVIFTNDGLYYKYIGKSTYIQYSDIVDVQVDSDDNLLFKLNSEDMPEFKLIDVFDMFILRDIVRELIAIDKEYGQSTQKTTGKVKKIDLSPTMMKKCKAIIHTASVACGGVGTGLAQIPASDNAVIVPIQVTMIVSLGTVFELNITESVAKSVIASAGASIAGRTATQILWGWIPVIGNAINTATAAGLTEAIGWIAVKNFYERWIEDKNKGRLDGMKDGYEEASGEYERKLRMQAEEFLNQKKDVEKEIEEYEKLLNEYEKYIQELEEKCESAKLLDEIKEIYNSLVELKKE